MKRNIVIFFLLAISKLFAQENQFEITGLSSTCDSIIKMFAHPSHGIGSINTSKGSTISFDKLKSMIKDIKHLDIKNNSFTVSKNNCRGIEIKTWKSKVDSSTIQTWTFNNSQNYDGNTYIDSVKEYYIKSGRKEIWITLSNNIVLLNLTVDKITYTPWYEIIIGGTQNTIAKYDSLQKLCR